MQRCRFKLHASRFKALGVQVRGAPFQVGGCSVAGLRVHRCRFELLGSRKKVLRCTFKALGFRLKVLRCRLKLLRCRSKVLRCRSKVLYCRSEVLYCRLKVVGSKPKALRLFANLLPAKNAPGGARSSNGQVSGSEAQRVFPRHSASYRKCDVRSLASDTQKTPL